jgi:hypothetical protein
VSGGGRARSRVRAECTVILELEFLGWDEWDPDYGRSFGWSYVHYIFVSCQPLGIIERPHQIA